MPGSERILAVFRRAQSLELLGKEIVQARTHVVALIQVKRFWENDPCPRKFRLSMLSLVRLPSLL